MLEEVEVAGGTTLFTKGDSGMAMYLIVDGCVRIHDNGATLDELSVGDVFGEMAVLDNAQRTATATTTEPTLVFQLHQDVLHDLMFDQPTLMHGMFRIMSTRLRQRLHDIADLRQHIDALTAQLNATRERS